MTPSFRGRMVQYAHRLLAQRMDSRRAHQLAEDVVHDALLFHLEHGPFDEPRAVGAVRFFALRRDGRHAAEGPPPLDVMQHGELGLNPFTGKRNKRMTGTFPNQIFGCSLAQAFEVRAEELEAA